MSKYSKAFKLKLIKQCLSGKSSPRQLSAVHGISHSNIRLWVSAYQAHGINTLSRCYTHYPAGFKLKVLKEMSERSLSLNETALQFDIASLSVIVHWQKLYNQGGPTALEFKSVTSFKTELERYIHYYHDRIKEKLKGSL